MAWVYVQVVLLLLNLIAMILILIELFHIFVLIVALVNILLNIYFIVVIRSYAIDLKSSGSGNNPS